MGDEMAIFSQLYPGVYRQIPPPPREPKPKRRRRRGRGEGGGGGDLEGGKKRKLSEQQVMMLEQYFGSEHKLESERKDRLASELGLDPRQVAVWFQNRRARWKNKKLEEEYSKLKSLHDSAILDKCRLEAEVLKLKDHLREADKQIQKLSSALEEGHGKRHDGYDVVNGSNSPSMTSISTEPPLPPPPPGFIGDFGYEMDDMLLYMPENSCSVQCMEWLSHYI
ncbi:hypothetical protein SAY87_020335 [Trapa incisa]|uniref:Homeobox-leucine zipper protein n=1 Tax=Trapa incisa TaxID=236973 RepID=A0AAN7Q4G9_9MYRT|nr:hypothetical protein SAY87_020335 [Trapa incisa]